MFKCTNLFKQFAVIFYWLHWRAISVVQSCKCFLISAPVLKDMLGVLYWYSNCTLTDRERQYINLWRLTGWLVFLSGYLHSSFLWILHTQHGFAFFPHQWRLQDKSCAEQRGPRDVLHQAVLLLAGREHTCKPLMATLSLSVMCHVSSSFFYPIMTNMKSYFATFEEEGL